MNSKKWYWKAGIVLAAVIGLLCGSSLACGSTLMHENGPVYGNGLVSCTRMTVFAQEQRVFDQAGLFSADEAKELEEQIAGITQDIKMDLVVVTAADTQGKSARAYADDFYDEGGFGVGKDASGALFLIDMDNREICISTAGEMRRYLTDSRIESMLDHAYDDVQQGDYAGAAAKMVEETAGWCHKAIPEGQYIYDEDTGKISRYHSIRWYEGLLALLIAGFCGFAACQNVRREYGMKREHQQAAGYLMSYRANAQFACRQQNDALVQSYVTQQVIPRSGGGSGGGRSGGFSGSGRSTVHRSSSGRSHGGGSRKF